MGEVMSLSKVRQTPCPKCGFRDPIGPRTKTRGKGFVTFTIAAFKALAKTGDITLVCDKCDHHWDLAGVV